MSLTHAPKPTQGRFETPPAGPKSVKVPVSTKNIHEEIRTQAEKIYHARNGGPGNQLSDWLQAEKAVQQRTHTSAAA